MRYKAQGTARHKVQYEVRGTRHKAQQGTRYEAQGTARHKVQYEVRGTRHKAQGTRHKAQGTTRPRDLGSL